MILSRFRRSSIVLVILVLTALCAGLAGNVATHARAQGVCISLASDSNGFGHVTLQLPDEDAAGDYRGEIGIVYVQPLRVLLEHALETAGLPYKVFDHSMVAGSLTSSGRTAYLKSDFYGGIFADSCQIVIVTPFIPDVAAGKATPEQYRVALTKLVRDVLASDPGAHVLVLNFYQTSRAKFTESNSGFGLTADRIQQFNDELAFACRPTGVIGRIDGATCLDTQSVFANMKSPYTLISANKAQYDALFFKETGFTPKINAYFAANPSGVLIGDGIHLNLAGREQLAASLVKWLATLQ